MKDTRPLYRKKAKRTAWGVTAFIIVLGAFMFFLYQSSQKLTYLEQGASVIPLDSSSGENSSTTDSSSVSPVVDQSQGSDQAQGQAQTPASAETQSQSAGQSQPTSTATSQPTSTTQQTTAPIISTGPNKPPTVDAGSDTSIILPTNSITLSANASDLDGSIVSYAWTIATGTGVIATPSAATTQVTDISPGFSTYRVTVTDNRGATDSDTVTIRVKYDTVQPSAQLTLPRNNTTVSGTVQLAATATDNIGVDHVDFYKNDSIIGASQTAPYTFNWDTTTVANGAYKIKAIAYDAASNYRVTNIITLNVKNGGTPVPDTTAPSVVLVTANGSSLSGVNASLSATASDDVAISKVDFYQGSSRIATDTTATGTTYSVSWDTTKMKNGSYLIKAVAIDTAGNSKTSGTATVNVANPATPPSSSSTSPSTSSASTSTSSKSPGSSSATASTTNTSAGDSTTAPITIPTDTDSSTGDSDTTAPTISITAPINGATISGSATITADADDDLGIDHVDFYQGDTRIGTVANTPYSVSWDTTKVANGSYGLSAIAYDAANNKKGSAPVTVTVSNKVISVASYDVGISFGDTLHSKNDAQLNAIFSDLNSEGITWVRFDLSWEDVQWNNATTYDWAAIDRIVADATAHHLKLLPDLGYTPPWARLASCSSGGDACQPANVQSFATFVQQTVARYTSKGITNWEIWNEPNNYHFWLPKPDANEYTQLLKVASVAVKNANPSATVIAAGLSPAVNDSRHIAPIDFLKGMYADGAKQYFDAIAMHPYAFPADPTQYEGWSGWSQMSQTSPSLRSVMISNGDSNKKIWLTEYGAPTGGPGTQAWVGYSNISDPNVDHVTDALQSQLIVDGITAAKAYSWAGPLFIYSYEDLGTSNDTIENFFGIKHKDGTPKTIYTALKALLLGQLF